MPETLDVTPTTLSVEHERFISQYLIDGNGTRAYMLAFPAIGEKSARTLAARLLAKVGIQAELKRRRSDVMARNGITLDALVNVLKIQALTPISEVLGDPRDLEGDKVLAVESYRAATAQTAEVTKIADRRGAVVELLDRFFPDVGKPVAQSTTPGGVTNVQINIDKAMIAVHDILARHRPG